MFSLYCEELQAVTIMLIDIRRMWLKCGTKFKPNSPKALQKGSSVFIMLHPIGLLSIRCGTQSLNNLTKSFNVLLLLLV